jgi:hypothetical protein
MKPDTSNVWTPEEDAALAALRRQGLPWRDIPAQMPGRTIHACQQRLFNLKLKSEGKQKNNPATRRARKLRKQQAALERREALAKKALGYAIARAEIAAAKEREAETNRQAAKSQPSARRLSTHVLIADSELRSRIEKQGPNGLFGDPMPGRSALDRRNAGAGA